MLGESEDALEVEEEFLRALVLLHSSAPDSEEKLRRMLDATLERRFGAAKILTARMSKNILGSEKSQEECEVENLDDPRAFQRRKRKESRRFLDSEVLTLSTDQRDEQDEREEDVPLDEPLEKEEDERKLGKIFHLDYYDVSSDKDIPRISIPDEGSSEAGALCKVCNGARLGPLILLECQDCQDLYHPLCHQPPVVDIDVYDPRLVWRCGRCATSCETCEFVLERKAFRRSRSLSLDEDENNFEEVCECEKDERRSADVSKYRQKPVDLGKTKDSVRCSWTDFHATTKPNIEAGKGDGDSSTSKARSKMRIRSSSSSKGPGRNFSRKRIASKFSKDSSFAR